jgi:pimeloyl-ACP methyl ester carboxylesterase
MKRAKRWLLAGEILAAIALSAGIGFLLRPVSYLDGWTYLREDIAGVESRSITVEGHRLHYEAEGPATGPALVLVHGLGSRAEDWQTLAPLLAKAGFRVYLPDLFGYGRSDWPADFSYSVRDQAGVVLAFMDAMGLKQADLGGWSMGGWIAQIVAGEHPERVRRLLLFDSAGLAVQPNWNTNLFMPRTAAELDQLEALLMPHPASIPGFVARDVVRGAQEHAWVTSRALNTMLTGADATDSLLPTLKMPVLILWGAEDRVTPPDQAERIHQLIPQSELKTFIGCGHLAPEQCAGTMSPIVVSFLER